MASFTDTFISQPDDVRNPSLDYVGPSTSELMRAWQAQKAILDLYPRFNIVAGYRKSGKTYKLSQDLAAIREQLQAVGCDFGEPWNSFYLIVSDINQQIYEYGNYECLKDILSKLHVEKSFSKGLLEDIELKREEQKGKPIFVIADDAGSTEVTRHTANAKTSILHRYATEAYNLNTFVVMALHDFGDAPSSIRKQADRIVIFNWLNLVQYKVIKAELRVMDEESWKSLMKHAFRKAVLPYFPHVIRTFNNEIRSFEFYYINQIDGEVKFDYNPDIA